MKTAKPLRLAVVGLGQRGLQHLKPLWQLQAENLVRIVNGCLGQNQRFEQPFHLGYFF